MCGSLFPKSSSGANWKDVDARGKAPFRAAECVHERFWSGMGTRNDEPGPDDHPASVTHTTPHRANKEQGVREKSNNNAPCARPNFLPCQVSSTPFIFPPSPSSEFWGIIVHNLLFFFKWLFF
jgi:hypothetical protein